MRIFLKRPLCLDGIGQFIIRSVIRSLIIILVLTTFFLNRSFQKFKIQGSDVTIMQTHHYHSMECLFSIIFPLSQQFPFLLSNFSSNFYFIESKSQTSWLERSLRNLFLRQERLLQKQVCALGREQSKLVPGFGCFQLGEIIVTFVT